MTAAAAATTSVSSRGPDPRAPAASRAASASNSPARSHPSPSTCSDASTTSVGDERAGLVPAAPHESPPVASSNAAPPSATAASGARPVAHDRRDDRGDERERGEDYHGWATRRRGGRHPHHSAS